MNIERTGILSATIVTPDLLPFAEQHNRATQRGGVSIVQEIISGNVLNVPLIKGAKWSYECEIIQTVHIGGCDTHFAAFRHVNVREDIQKLDFIDLREINPVIYSPNNYFTVGEHIGKIGNYANPRQMAKTKFPCCQNGLKDPDILARTPDESIAADLRTVSMPARQS